MTLHLERDFTSSKEGAKKATKTALEIWKGRKGKIESVR